MSIINLKDFKQRKQLEKAEKDIEKVLFFCQKMYPALNKYKSYTGVHGIMQKIQECETFLTLHQKRIKLALKGAKNEQSPQ